MLTRICNKCGEEKYPSCFSSDKSRPTGLSYTCKECNREKDKKRYSYLTDEVRKQRREKQNGRNRERKQEVVDMFGGKCADCEQTYPNCVYEFHHLDPEQKDITPQRAISLGNYEELEKCVMLCANCHRMRHNEGID